MSDRSGRRLGRRTLLGAGAFAASASLLPAACAHARPRLPVRQPGERPTPVLNLRAFGAKGDGRTNDTDAFARAAAAINAAGRGTLLIPPGTYHCCVTRCAKSLILPPFLSRTSARIVD